MFHTLTKMIDKTMGKIIKIRSFRTKGTDGHSVKTIFCLFANGSVVIERRIVSLTLEHGFKEIRTFGKYIYQFEVMSFKYDSFLCIAYGVLESLDEIKTKDIIRGNDVISDDEPLEKK